MIVYSHLWRKYFLCVGRPTALVTSTSIKKNVKKTFEGSVRIDKGRDWHSKAVSTKMTANFTLDIDLLPLYHCFDAISIGPSTYVCLVCCFAPGWHNSFNSTITDIILHCFSVVLTNAWSQHILCYASSSTLNRNCCYESPLYK